jgi:hypothetical protein
MMKFEGGFDVDTSSWGFGFDVNFRPPFSFTFDDETDDREYPWLISGYITFLRWSIVFHVEGKRNA